MRYRKTVNILLILVLLYVGLVVVFESLLGVFQPEAETTQTITTFDDEGNAYPRVVARLESEGELYVAANHWPRAWYGRSLENPRMAIEFDGTSREYVVQPVPNNSQEFERVNKQHSLGLVFRFLTGFPPRRLVRLEPQDN